jgi:hypothetical protein
MVCNIPFWDGNGGNGAGSEIRQAIAIVVDLVFDGGNGTTSSIKKGVELIKSGTITFFPPSFVHLFLP